MHLYSDLKSPAETYDIRQHYLVDRPPMSIAGVADGPASQGGVVWLTVTYAKGTTWTDEPTPIEEPIFIAE